MSGVVSSGSCNVFFLENIFLREFHIFPWISHFNNISFPLLLCFCSGWILKSGPKHHLAMSSVLQNYLCTPTNEKEHLLPNLHGVFSAKHLFLHQNVKQPGPRWVFNNAVKETSMQQIQSLTIRTPQFCEHFLH